MKNPLETEPMHQSEVPSDSSASFSSVHMEDDCVMASPTGSKNQEIISAIVANGQNDFSDSPYHGRGDLARKLIQEAAISAGYSVATERMRVFRVFNDSIWSIFSQNTPDASVVATAITRNKQLTKTVLARQGIPVPAGRVFRDKGEALAYFKTRSIPQVVKPLFGEGGYGVTAGVQTDTSFTAAWEKARERAQRVIIEDFFSGDEVRIITLGGVVVAAVCRTPASVLGDGQHSVRELVAIKNRSRRGNPLLKIYPLKDFIQLELDGRSLDEIPPVGEHVILSTVSNVAMGGESVCVMRDLHPSVLQMAEKAARSIPGATLLGLDVLVNDFSYSVEGGNAVVLEVNSNPAIATLFFAAYGEPASDLPRKMIESFSWQGHETAPRSQDKALPRILPAVCYMPPCGGASFRRNYSVQMCLVRQAAYARNLDVVAVSAELTLLCNGEERAAFFQGMCSRTRSVVRRATNNKEWTKELLGGAGVQTPRGESFPASQYEEAWTFLASTGLPMVVKPIVGSGGNGVSTEVQTQAHFEKAWNAAVGTGVQTILIEEYVKGNDYRVLVVGNAICAVTHRIPAYVVGDGVHTVTELVALKSEARRVNPYYGAKPFELAPMMLHNLAQCGMDGDTVVAKDRHVTLHTVANIGSGGEGRDITDSVHPGWASIAAKTRQAVYDPVHIGFDLIAEDITRSPAEQQWRVIEVNSNPDLGMQHFPSEGSPRDVAGALIEYLFSGSGLNLPPCTRHKVAITGKVQGVGYRQWLWRQAHLHSVRGGVRNLTDGTVEAVFIGPPNAVRQLLVACKGGPAKAKVETVVVEKISGEDAFREFCPGALMEGFEIYPNVISHP